MAWNGAGGETWEYTTSAEGVIEECGPSPKPAPNDDDDMVVFEEDELPGGVTLWFSGAAPGDVDITFTTKNADGKTVYIQKYTIRVFDDLRLAELDIT